MRSSLYSSDHEDYRGSVREFVRREVVPNLDRWNSERLIDRDVWLAAGKQGMLGTAAPERFGGGGVTDFRFRCVVVEELAKVGAAALSANFGLQDDIVVPYLLDLACEEINQRWLPGMVRGEAIGAIAMTEPGAGSDLQSIETTAVRDGDEWVLNGAKTFISNGIQADIVIVVARTDPGAGSRGISLLLVERDMQGFERGRKLDKIGLHAADTAELFFHDVRVPATNLLGTEGRGFLHLMERLPQERMSITVQALMSARAAFEWTVGYTRERHAFGQPLAQFQNTQFELAEMATELDVLEAYVYAQVNALNAGELTAVDAAKGKLASTDTQVRVIDRCLQLFGGYGYMLEYPIARAFADARAQRIYGGTNEIMKTIIARDLTGLR